MPATLPPPTAILAEVPPGLYLLAAGALVVGFAAGLWAGWLWAARRGRGLISRAQEIGERLVEEARGQADQEARALLAQAEEEAERRIRNWEQEEQRRREALEQAEQEAERRHRRLVDRDRALARRDQLLSGRERDLEKRQEELDAARRRIADLEEQVLVRLEETAELGRDEAKRQLMEEVRAEARRAAAADLRAIKDELQRTSELEAQKIIALAVERLSSDFSAERAVSTVPLPDQNMRGRIIGAEGRNIRAFENLTGMQLVLDDAPDHVIVSGFNPIRREVARRSLERLIEGGTIHPRKIQQVVHQVRRKVDEEIVAAGRKVIEEFGLDGVHPEMVELLGRLRYRTSYGQNVLAHVREAARICGIMAAELRLDQKLAERAALFHDIGKAVDFEQEGTHPEIGGEIARRCGEHEVVVNAIESHHEDCEVIHPISVLVAAADAISGSRPGARRRTTVDYIRRIAKLEELGRAFDGVRTCYALQAGRELRVIVGADRVSDDDAALLSHDLAKRIQEEMDYPGRIKVTVIREVRAQAVAR
ncbi:MAG: ribonuclease Y [Acidobacteria bacterium]|nr:MAG: ribonuclease Y [Acidobacteriota bacterium]